MTFNCILTIQQAASLKIQSDSYHLYFIESAM